MRFSQGPFQCSITHFLCCFPQLQNTKKPNPIPPGSNSLGLLIFIVRRRSNLLVEVNLIYAAERFNRKVLLGEINCRDSSNDAVACLVSLDLSLSFKLNWAQWSYVQLIFCLTSKHSGGFPQQQWSYCVSQYYIAETFWREKKGEEFVKKGPVWRGVLTVSSSLDCSSRDELHLGWTWIIECKWYEPSDTEAWLCWTKMLVEMRSQ